MFNLTYRMLWLSIALLTVSAHGAEKSMHLPAKLSALSTKTQKHASTNVHVICARTHKTLYNKNMHHCCTPASTLKLFTVAAALHILGPEYRFATALYHDGHSKHGTLKGNLYLKGSGDPSFTSADLTELFQQIKAAGIKKITGNLILDASVFDAVEHGPGWSWDDIPAAWNSPLTGLNINHNCIEVIVDPQAEQLVTLNPATNFVTIENKAHVVEKKQPSQKTIKVNRLWLNKKNVITVTGTIARHAAPRPFSLALKHPLHYVAALCKEMLDREHIQLKGSITDGVTPSCAEQIAVHHSAPLKALIQPVLKISDNLYADALFKTIGIEQSGQQYGAPGTWEKGSTAMLKFLKEIQLFDTSIVTIVDGSGRSRYNLLAPSHITALLAWMQQQPWYAAVRDALPHAGVDGGLQKRMRPRKTRDRVHAKTGTLKGISALAGYIEPHHTDPVIFAINTTNFTGPASVYRTLEDEICATIAMHKPHPPQRKKS